MKTKTALLMLLILTLAQYGPAAGAATITAASCSKADIESAIGRAAAGDTIKVPAGSCSWSDYITVGKRVAIVGADSLQTTVNGRGFRLAVGTDGARISKINFASTSVATAIYVGAARSLTGTRNFRIDNCRFTGYAAWVQLDGRCTGVLDHNEFFKCTGEGIYIFGDDEAAWARDTGLGSSDFVFIENNLFDTKGTQNGHFILANFGSRSVIRYNTFQETGGARSNDWIDMHGYCHGSYDRGARVFEIYNNRMVRGYNGCCRGLFLRGGTGVVYNNTFDQAGGQFVYNGTNAPVFMVDYRSSKWAGTKSVCSPTCNKAQWCDSGEGYPCCDQIGRGKDKCPQSSPCGQNNEPVYFWNNKNHAGTAVPIKIDSGSASYIVVNRDFFTAQKPGYTAYTYPHPLAGGVATTTATTTAAGTRPAPPADFRIIPNPE